MFIFVVDAISPGLQVNRVGKFQPGKKTFSEFQSGKKLSTNFNLKKILNLVVPNLKDIGSEDIELHKKFMVGFINFIALFNCDTFEILSKAAKRKREY